MTDEADLVIEVERWFEAQGFRMDADATDNGLTEITLVGDSNPSVVWPRYASGPSLVLAVLAAEQRWLVEEEGSGGVAGETYLDKAEERLRRALG